MTSQARVSYFFDEDVGNFHYGPKVCALTQNNFCFGVALYRCVSTGFRFLYDLTRLPNLASNETAQARTYSQSYSQLWLIQRNGSLQVCQPPTWTLNHLL